MAVVPRKRSGRTVFGVDSDEMKSLVREALREELGPSSFAAESSVIDDEESYKALEWDRRELAPADVGELAAGLGLDQLLSCACEFCGPFRDKVYFIQCGEGGPVKIGTSKCVSQRLDELQLANPVGLRLRGAVPGDRTVESFYHQLFAAQKLRGEWFMPCSRMELIMRAAARLMGDRRK